MCSFKCLCGVLEFCQVCYPEGRYPPLHKSASRSTLGVDMKSLKDSMDCATKSAGRHLQDVSCIGADDIVIIIIESMPLVSGCYIEFRGCTHGDVLYIRFGQWMCLPFAFPRISDSE